MYTLRIIRLDEVITNIWLGKSYSKKIYDYSVINNKTEIDKTINAFGLITAHDTGEQYELKDDCLYYIMTDSGKTFEYINRV